MRGCRVDGGWMKRCRVNREMEDRWKEWMKGEWKR